MAARALLVRRQPPAEPHVGVFRVPQCGEQGGTYGGGGRDGGEVVSVDCGGRGLTLAQLVAPLVLPRFLSAPPQTAIMLSHIRYGIQLGLQSFTLNPFGPESFEYVVGNIAVSYAPTAVRLQLPPALPGRVRAVSLRRLKPGATFKVTTSGCASAPPAFTVAADAAGAAAFAATVCDPPGAGGVTPCVISLVAVE